MSILYKAMLVIGGMLLAGLGAVLVYWFIIGSSEPAVPAVPTDPDFLDTTLPIEARIDDLLSYMTKEEKIGQMALVEKNSLKNNSDIAAYHLGGLLSGSGAKPEENTAEGWFEMIAGYQTAAAAARLPIPLLYGVDAIHGHAHVPGATVFPHAIGLGAANDSALIQAIGRATAVELAATGVNWNYAPNLDLPQDIRWGRVYEAFSTDPVIVAELGAAYIRGLTPLILPTLKHYVGLGSMEWRSSLNKNFQIDQGVAPADEKELARALLPPFKAGIEAGALSVMAGLNQWGHEKVITNHELLTTVLKEEQGFTGFVVSDWYGVYEGRASRFLATIDAINAGVDMVMLPFDYKSFTRNMLIANRFGLISDERIDDAVRRILRAKFAIGLFDGSRETRSDLTVVGSAAHRALARTAVAASLVVLKNEAEVLPIDPNSRRIYVAGSAADNAGRQSGAWTVEWQGVDGNWLPGATSILDGIRASVGDGTLIEYSETGQFDPVDRLADVGIAVVGEAPYAEGWGDKEYPILSDADLEAIKRLEAIAKQVVVVIVSGRPLFVSNEIDDWEGLIAAWLPGSEGAGVADVLFGRVPAGGELPLPWPRTAEQLPISLDGTTADGTAVLFPRRYGLSI